MVRPALIIALLLTGAAMLLPGLAAAQDAAPPGPADNRMEAFEAPPGAEANAAATGALFYGRDLRRYPSGAVLLDGELYGLRQFVHPPRSETRYPVCEGERFQDQWSGARCSVVLLAPDVVATDRQCVDGHAPDDLFVVFDLGLERGGALSLGRAPGAVFRGVEIRTAGVGASEGDWALLRLDRPTDRAPASRTERAPKKGDPVYMMGHPRGLPLKTASGMVVKEPGPVNFRADVDAMRDSPGSPIFDAGHKLAGILVGGDSDWVLDEANGCLAAKPGSPKQETAVRIDRLPDPAGPWPKP